MMSPVMTPVASRKILWADDGPRDIEGLPRYLRFLGHDVVTTVDFETTAEMLVCERFDLLVVDQQMPKDGRRADDAGSRLVQALSRGEFGDLNVGLPFVFFTASEDWVSKSDIRVEDIDGFLGIEEKGDDLYGPLEEYLREVPRRASQAVDEDDGDDDCQGPELPARAAAHAAEEWAGVVTEVEQETFYARLTAIDQPLPDHEAVIPRQVVSERNQPRIVEGATFRWSVDVEDEPSGERVTRSRLRFDEELPLSEAEIAEARERVRARRELDASSEA